MIKWYCPASDYKDECTCKLKERCHNNKHLDIISGTESAYVKIIKTEE